VTKQRPYSWFFVAEIPTADEIKTKMTNSRNSRRAPCVQARDLLRCLRRSRRSAGEVRQPKPPRRKRRRGPANHQKHKALAKILYGLRAQ
jgi:hypothetical protein